MKFVDFLVKHISMNCNKQWNVFFIVDQMQEDVAYEEARTLRLLFDEIGTLNQTRQKF